MVTELGRFLFVCLFVFPNHELRYIYLSDTVTQKQECNDFNDSVRSLKYGKNN